jgi:hypothetical protein
MSDQGESLEHALSKASSNVICNFQKLFLASAITCLNGKTYQYRRQIPSGMTADALAQPMASTAMQSPV